MQHAVASLEASATKLFGRKTFVTIHEMKPCNTAAARDSFRVTLKLMRATNLLITFFIPFN